MLKVKTQISLGINPDWSESSLYAQLVTKDVSFHQADSEDSDQKELLTRLIGVVSRLNYSAVLVQTVVYYSQTRFGFKKETNCLIREGNQMSVVYFIFL